MYHKNVTKNYLLFTLLVQVKNMKSLEVLVNQNLKCASLWCEANKLTFNTQKNETNDV